MALRTYGGTSQDFLADPYGNQQGGGAYSVFTDRAHTTDITSTVTDKNGNPFPNNQPVADAVGLVEFTVADTYTDWLWVATYDTAGATWREPVRVGPADIPSRLAVAETTGGGGGGAVASVNGHTGTVVLSKADVGLGNVDNTTDVGKPVSTAQASALAGKVDTTDGRLTDARTPTAHHATHASNGSDPVTPADIGALASSARSAANGVAALDATGKIPTNQLPPLAISDTFVVGSQTAMLGLAANTGDVAVRTDQNKTYILQGADPTILSNWVEIPAAGAVTSVHGRTGTVDLDDVYVGLGDSRLTDQRTPSDGSVTTAKFAAGAIDPVAGTGGARTLGTGAQQAAAGNDARLSDTRTPTDASVTPAKFASSAIDPAAGTAGARTLGAGAQQAMAGNDSRVTSLPATYEQVVMHGTDATVARPSTSLPVMWVGSVDPNNAATGDLVVNTSEVVPGSTSLLAAPVVFTASGTWTPSTTGRAIFRAVVIGGGGGGAAGGAGTTGGGGGGGGEVLSGFDLGNVTSPQTVTIGGGGSAGANGSATSIGALVTAAGGKGASGQGGAAAGDGTPGLSGGVSGGIPASSGGGGGGAGTSGVGSRGGPGLLRLGAGGGGGGGPTSAAGGPGGSSAGGTGGTGTANGGGGGGANGVNGGNGTSGQGGAGATAPANSGSGGGGGGAGTAGGAGGAGGSGYVVIYQVA